MRAPDLETTAFRAVELAVQARTDPRLLVASRRRLPTPKKTARLLAALTNAADGRQALLLVGIDGTEIHGLDEPVSQRWWRAVHDAFPGTVPELHSTTVEIGEVEVLAVSPGPAAELVTAWKGKRVIVPMFDGAKAVEASAQRPPDLAHAVVDALPSMRILGGWVEQAECGDEPVDSYGGHLSLELQAISGVMADKSCSATLLVPDYPSPIPLDVQAHPVTNGVGVLRRARGIEVRATFRVDLLLAGAVQAPTLRGRPSTAQLVVSLLLPGRSVPELRSLFLSPDPSADGRRWVL